MVDPDSNIGNRIESITQRTAIIEGKNKVFFVKISIGIFVLKTHVKLPILGLLVLGVIQTVIQNPERRQTVSELCLHGRRTETTQRAVLPADHQFQSTGDSVLMEKVELPLESDTGAQLWFSAPAAY